MPDRSTPTAEQKSALRRRMRLLRGLIDDRVLRSVGLWAQVAALDRYASAGCVMGFVGVDGEPDTDSLFARLAADGKRLVLPDVSTGELVARTIGAGLVAGRFRIPAPQGDPVPATSIDLVLVPGLAFTPDGARLGQGGGFYDRFIAALPAGCLTVGVCFAEQLVDELPTEPHDRSVDVVVSDGVRG